MALPDPVDFLRRLVAFDTTSSRSNLDLIRFIAEYLREWGIEPRLVPDESGTKAGLFATIGPMVPGGVVLSGHTDVVPVAGQAWSADPFTLIERDGLLYGRGTADMKSFIAVALAMVPEFNSRRLKVPIHFAFSYDEELGCLGAPPLLERLVAEIPMPAAAIIGEPSEMKVANRHRSINTFTTTIRGRPGHASRPDKGVNAILSATDCIAEIGRIADDLEATAQRNSGGDRQPLTFNIGTIEGGTAVNIIAEHCRFIWECRTGTDIDGSEVGHRLRSFAEGELLPRMREQAPEAEIAVEQTVSVPPLSPLAGSPAEALALRLSGHNGCVSVPFATEAGLFQQAGIPAVICGPGSTAQAHQPDEFVSLEQLDACQTFMRRLADHAEQG